MIISAAESSRVALRIFTAGVGCYGGLNFYRTLVGVNYDNRIPESFRQRMRAGFVAFTILFITSLIFYAINGFPFPDLFHIFFFFFVITADVYALLFIADQKKFEAKSDLPIPLLLYRLLRHYTLVALRILYPDYYSYALIVLLSVFVTSKEMLDFGAILIIFTGVKTVRIFLHLVNTGRSLDISRSPYATFISLVFSTFVMIYLFAVIYTVTKLHRGPDIIDDTWNCLYFSAVTWTTLGYGDVTPTSLAKFYAAAEAITGYIVMTIMVASLLTLSKREN